KNQQRAPLLSGTAETGYFVAVAEDFQIVPVGTYQGISDRDFVLQTEAQPLSQQIDVIAQVAFAFERGFVTDFDFFGLKKLRVKVRAQLIDLVDARLMNFRADSGELVFPSLDQFVEFVLFLVLGS